MSQPMSTTPEVPLAHAPFITLEGGEGAGKTTQLSMLARRTRALGLKVKTSREPGGTMLGQGLRALVKGAREEYTDPLAELLIFMADRAQHVSQLVRPHLERGVVVLCDRYTDSSEVYQGRVRGLDLARVEELNRLVTGGLVPDLTILLDLDPALGLGRAQARQESLGQAGDRLEAEGLEFHLRVRQGFLDQAAAHPGRFALVDAGQPQEAVAEAVWALAEPVLRAYREACASPGS